MDRIDIGFLEKCETWRLESRFFPSKVGGKPAWLHLKNLPSVEDVKCKNCDKPCAFLCQIYAPYEDDPQGFHRTIFIFICKDENCCKANTNRNLCVLRSQLPRENEFYPSTKPDEDEENWRPDLKAANFTKICKICALAAPKHCGKCKKVNYCCREHQNFDWKSGHRENCKLDTENTDILAKNPFLFPEFEIIIESDIPATADDKNDVESEKIELEKYEKLVESGQAGTMQSEDEVDQDLLKMAASEEDETFAEFHSTIKRDPDQVLRYDRGGRPLYISSYNQPEDIPRCEECHGERQFEFQIMPQLLNHLDFQDVLKSLDWGILSVFTCKNSCKTQSAYVREFIWKQDIVDCTPNKSVQ